MQLLQITALVLLNSLLTILPVVKTRMLKLKLKHIIFHQ